MQMLKVGVPYFFTIFLLHIPQLYVLSYNKQLKRLKVLIRFLRFPKCPVLLNGVAQCIYFISGFSAGNR